MMTTKKEVMLSFKERELVLATQDMMATMWYRVCGHAAGKEIFLIRKLEIKTGTRMHIGMWVVGSSVHDGMWVPATRQKKPTRPCRAVCLPASTCRSRRTAGNEQKKNSGANTRTARDPAAAADPLGCLHVCCVFSPLSFWAFPMHFFLFCDEHIERW